MKKIIFFGLTLIVVFAAGFILGNSDYFFGKYDYFKKSAIIFQPSEQRLEDGIFTNSLLDCEIADGTINVEFTNFKSTVEQYLKNNIDGKDLSYVSVYFRNLNNGLWFGINEKEKFSPASLLKVPLMISYFKAAENNPAILKQKLRLDKKFDISNLKQVVPPSSEIEIGKDYSVADLINRSTSRSDNQATALLTNFINDKSFEENLFAKLGFPKDDITNIWTEITVKEYASFFRILFNASYLSRDYSERALYILSKSEFRSGLVAGVSQNIVVSHKFGERGDLAGGVQQFHDCGIIYYPKFPYILCIMSRGQSDDKLISAISEISKIVYNRVDEQAKNF